MSGGGWRAFRPSRLAAALAAALFVCGIAGPAGAVRLKDLGGWTGVRSNPLVGYGLVVGLAGTGDSNRAVFTVQSLASMLGRIGIRVSPGDIRVRNVAAVMVTAELPPFARVGGRFDVTVSSVGNAKSLQGGTLLLTELEGPDGRVHALAQGPLVVGGYTASASGSSVTKNHPTVGRVANGGTVEVEVAVDLSTFSRLVFQLGTADFATAAAVADAMRGAVAGAAEGVRMLDAATVEVNVPEGALVPELMASLEALEVVPDTAARVVLCERTGTVVLGGDVRIGTIAVSHGNLRVEVTATREASQPGPLSRGRTTVVEQSRVVAEEEGGRLQVIEGGVRLGELVDALNALGATPRDLIDILQAIKAAGALRATLVIM